MANNIRPNMCHEIRGVMSQGREAGHYKSKLRLGKPSSGIRRVEYIEEYETESDRVLRSKEMIGEG